MRIPLIAGNWKMNTTVDEATSLVKQMLDDLEKIGDVEKIVCPPFISLVPVRNLLQGTSVLLGAQNVFYEEKGAFTGEISPVMLSGICQYVIIGHSERRQYFKEDGEMISKKVSAALKHNLRPILCVGESLQDHEGGKTREVVTDQLLSSLSGITQVDSVTIAYEPVWAIGTGRAANGKEANKTVKLIRTLIENKYGKTVASNIRILYGGSVTSSNISEFVSQSEIDGALVGGASLRAREFIGIVKQTAEIKKGFNATR